ncbi:MAG: hypothetical protein WCI27_06845 [Candidatus Omnitrophota bacterium]
MKKAQSILEYTILLIIIIAAFLTMQNYMKRGFQGRWKQAVDDLGDQYESNAFDGQTRYLLNTTAESRLLLVPSVMAGVNGTITYREDSSQSAEVKRITTSMSLP